MNFVKTSFLKQLPFKFFSVKGLCKLYCLKGFQ